MGVSRFTPGRFKIDIKSVQKTKAVHYLLALMQVLHRLKIMEWTLKREWQRFIRSFFPFKQEVMI